MTADNHAYPPGDFTFEEWYDNDTESYGAPLEVARAAFKAGRLSHARHLAALHAKWDSIEDSAALNTAHNEV